MAAGFSSATSTEYVHTQPSKLSPRTLSKLIQICMTVVYVCLCGAWWGGTFFHYLGACAARRLRTSCIIPQSGGFGSALHPIAVSLSVGLPDCHLQACVVVKNERRESIREKGEGGGKGTEQQKSIKTNDEWLCQGYKVQVKPARSLSQGRGWLPARFSRVH